LDGLELLAMARRRGILDRAIVDEFLIAIVRRELISLSTLTDIRTAWREKTIYQDLGDLLLKYEAKRKTLPTF
jgi:hypothetical protein